MISAAVVGVILNLALWFAIHAARTGRAGRGGPLRFDVPVLASVDPWRSALAACIAVLRQGQRAADVAAAAIGTVAAEWVKCTKTQ
jgi:chromate transporter